MTDHSAGLQAQVVQAREQGLRLGIAGSGSYASYLPQPAAALLQIAPHRGVVSYEPSELVITVRAGTPLLELDALLAAQGQCLGGECPRLSAEIGRAHV